MFELYQETNEGLKEFVEDDFLVERGGRDAGGGGIW